MAEQGMHANRLARDSGLHSMAACFAIGCTGVRTRSPSTWLDASSPRCRMRQHALDNFKRLDVDVRNDTPVVEVRR